jgi:hypothetical protein
LKLKKAKWDEEKELAIKAAVEEEKVCYLEVI